MLMREPFYYKPLPVYGALLRPLYTDALLQPLPYKICLATQISLY